MTLPTLNRFLQGTIAILFVTFAGQVSYEYFFNKPDPVLLAAWAFDPRNLAEAKGLAKDVVEAQVTKVERADDLVIPAPGEPGGVERIAIEVISMKVKGAMKGKQGKNIQVFRTAGIPVGKRDMPNMKDAPPKPKGASKPPSRPTPFFGNTINTHDDQRYNVGENYVMFLRDGPQVKMKGKRIATKALVNPSTRFKVGKDNKVTPLVPDGLGKPFKGRTLQQFKDVIQKTKGRGPVKGKLPGQMVLPAFKFKPGMVRPRGIEGGKMLGGIEQELSEMEIPTEGEAPVFQ